MPLLADCYDCWEASQALFAAIYGPGPPPSRQAPIARPNSARSRNQAAARHSPHSLKNLSTCRRTGQQQQLSWVSSPRTWADGRRTGANNAPLVPWSPSLPPSSRLRHCYCQGCTVCPARHLTHLRRERTQNASPPPTKVYIDVIGCPQRGLRAQGTVPVSSLGVMVGSALRQGLRSAPTTHHGLLHDATSFDTQVRRRVYLGRLERKFPVAQ